MTDSDDDLTRMGDDGDVRDLGTFRREVLGYLQRGLNPGEDDRIRKAWHEGYDPFSVAAYLAGGNNAQG